MREQVTRLNQDSLNLAKPVARLKIRKNFFSRRVNNLWNTLPYDVKHAKNTIQFKQLYQIIRIIENGVAADLRKNEATSDL